MHDTVSFFQGVKCFHSDRILMFIKDSDDKQVLSKKSSVLLPHVGRNDDDNNNSKGLFPKIYTSFAFHYGQKKGLIAPGIPRRSPIQVLTRPYPA